MAKIQKQFDDFHGAIKLGRFDEEKTLRDKRDIIRGKVEDKLPAVFDKYGEDCPDFSFLDQGSYQMGTGTKPLGGDFDIDQGLYFDSATDAFPDPVVLKQRVHEALDGHTKDVQIRRPCVTVFYQENGEPIYHVDIAVYSDGANTIDGKPRLAKGKEDSALEYRIWEISDPQGLADTVLARFTGNDRQQFRRIVRYLKRWRDLNFPEGGHARPLGVALTVATCYDLQPTYADVFAGKPDDLGALRSLVSRILNRFAYVWNSDEGACVYRLAVKLPVEPYNDLFEQMTNKQMQQFETKLTELGNALDAAAGDVDPRAACLRLQEVFGQNFPVPAVEETAKWFAPAITSSSNSA